jgi:CcmD family protein
VTEWPFIAVAYGLTWTVLAGYGIHLIRKRARAAHRLERVLKNEGGVQ